MRDVNYPKLLEYLEKIFYKYKVNPELILELACGTGNISIPLSQKGYEIIGLDVSSDMLSIAKQKSIEQNTDVLFLQQDMTSFELYGTVDAIICFIDGVNYITDSNSILKMFNLVNNYLNPNGIFVFDIRSQYALEHIIGNNTFVEDTQNISYIWQNEFNKKNRTSNMFVTFFVRSGHMYKKFCEHHCLKVHTIDEIKQFLQQSNFKSIETFDNLTFNEPYEQSERIFFVAQKKLL